MKESEYFTKKMSLGGNKPSTLVALRHENETQPLVVIQNSLEKSRKEKLMEIESLGKKSSDAYNSIKVFTIKKDLDLTI